jgi:hypothetical protein
VGEQQRVGSVSEMSHNPLDLRSATEINMCVPRRPDVKCLHLHGESVTNTFQVLCHNMYRPPLLLLPGEDGYRTDAHQPPITVWRARQQRNLEHLLQQYGRLLENKLEVSLQVGWDVRVVSLKVSQQQHVRLRRGRGNANTCTGETDTYVSHNVSSR